MKRVKIVLAIVFVTLGGLIVWRVMKPSDEAVYEGKKLSVWLKGYTTVSSYGWTSSPSGHTAEIDEAVRQIGTNAVPTLLSMLQARDSNLEAKMKLFVNGQHIIHLEWPFAAQLHYQAVRAIHVLGDKAQGAIPALIQLGNLSTRSSGSYAAVEGLGCIGPAAKEAVPYLVQWGDRPTWRNGVLSALLQIDPEAAAKAGITNSP